MAGRVRIPDLYIPWRSRYSELFSRNQTGVQAQLDVTGTGCLRLGDSGGRGGQKCPDDILDGGGRSGQERIPVKRASFVRTSERGSYRGRCQGPLGSLHTRFTFLRTICDVVPTEVEQLYQKSEVFKRVRVTLTNGKAWGVGWGGVGWVWGRHTFSTQILQLLYCIYKPEGNHSAPVTTACESPPIPLSQAPSGVQTKEE